MLLWNYIDAKISEQRDYKLDDVIESLRFELIKEQASMIKTICKRIQHNHYRELRGKLEQFHDDDDEKEEN